MPWRVTRTHLTPIWRFIRYLLFWPLRLELLSSFQMLATYPPSAFIRRDPLRNSWPFSLRPSQKEHHRAKGRQCKNRVMSHTFIIVEVQKNLLVDPLSVSYVSWRWLASLISRYYHRRGVSCSTSLLFAHKDSWWIHYQSSPIILQQSDINIFPRNNYIYPEVPGPEAGRYHHESSARIRRNQDCSGTFQVQAKVDGII